MCGSTTLLVGVPLSFFFRQIRSEMCTHAGVCFISLRYALGHTCISVPVRGCITLALGPPSGLFLLAASLSFLSFREGFFACRPVTS